ncbi:ECF-type sigma factor [Roseisolibacter sp. H3M3-2]|uniref:ECF-type sigma factor n=1 Tax=Roseisolibacter sp. H3M3-2 TaxID=3031323 RepID=UPI0023DC7A19|nr:ECF-type sigma factor [Roseisolibacter sp. H3M3-2]MDF1502392.1 ECF-type sigma factor [Roseisolibacter sp. H3M3-2]
MTAPHAPAGDVTRLLHDASGGDRAAYDRLFALAHEELRGVAERQLRRSDARRALDPGELVSELYLKLRDQLRGEWQGRAHFYGVAARAMRQILVDLARRDRAVKRGGGDWSPTTLTGKQLPADVALDDVLALDAALDGLDARQRQVVELRFFAGASEQEIADALGLSTRTVQREWVKARAWLYRALYPTGDGHADGDAGGA